MRKTKLIILPTKCLNRLGFLLLFLSCPVIGDWGRIRPDTEMSQWSIQIDREGSCGLVRDSSGIKNAMTPDGTTQCFATDAEHRNNTQSLTEMSQEPITDSISRLEFPIRKSTVEGRNVRSSRVDVAAKIRLSHARRESQERVSRRFVQARQIRTERRAISLDRRSERMQREVRRQELDNRENRMSRSLDRRVDSRRASIERRVDNARRFSVSRQEREMRGTFETARRREVRSIQPSSGRRNDRRVEEGRLTRRVLHEERREERRDAERRSVARRDIRLQSERRNSPELRRMERRERRDAERVAERRSLEKMNREATGRRSKERANVREGYTRSARQTDRRVRDAVEISRRREDGERNARSAVRNERRMVPDIRRIESDLSRKQEMRVSDRRVDKPQERRNFLSEGMREHREKSARVDYRMGYVKPEPLFMKDDRWNFLDGLKTWFGQKNVEEESVSNHGDLATTCLLGAAVYFLTSRQVKTV